MAPLASTCERRGTRIGGRGTRRAAPRSTEPETAAATRPTGTARGEEAGAEEAETAAAAAATAGGGEGEEEGAGEEGEGKGTAAAAAAADAATAAAAAATGTSDPPARRPCVTVRGTETMGATVDGSAAATAPTGPAARLSTLNALRPSAIVGMRLAVVGRTAEGDEIELSVGAAAVGDEKPAPPCTALGEDSSVPMRTADGRTPEGDASTIGSGRRSGVAAAVCAGLPAGLVRGGVVMSVSDPLREGVRTCKGLFSAVIGVDPLWRSDCCTLPQPSASIFSRLIGAPVGSGLCAVAAGAFLGRTLCAGCSAGDLRGTHARSVLPCSRTRSCSLSTDCSITSHRAQPCTRRTPAMSPTSSCAP